MKVIPGKYVSYDLAVWCIDVGKGRLAARPGDKELIGQQIDFRSESIIAGARGVDPIFTSALAGMAVGEYKSLEVSYPDYDTENIAAVPMELLISNGYTPEKIKPGLILNRDILRNKVKLNDEATDLEVLSTKTERGKSFVLVDSNDPLRGLKVRYDIEVTEIRIPTDDETKLEAILP